MKYITIILLFILFISCSKEDKPVTEKKTKTENPPTMEKGDTIENPEDTNMTPEERFSTSIMSDFLNDSEDEDLQGFLEDEVFKYSDTYTGAALVEMTPSTWLLSLEKNNSSKNYIIQKYVDFHTNDYYFRMNETNLKITDLVAKPQ